MFYLCFKIGTDTIENCSHICAVMEQKVHIVRSKFHFVGKLIRSSKPDRRPFEMILDSHHDTEQVQGAEKVTIDEQLKFANAFSINMICNRLYNARMCESLIFFYTSR